MHDPQWVGQEVPRLVVELFERSHYAFHPASVPHFVAAAAILATGALVLRWEQGSRISRMFALFSVFFAVWASFHGLLRLTVDSGIAVILGRNLYMVVSLAVPLLFQFTQILLRNDARRAGLIRFNWLAGIVFAIASAGTDWVVVGAQRYPWGLEPMHGSLGAGLVLWIFAMTALNLRDLMLVHRRTLPATVERRRIRLFAVAFIALALTGVDFLSGSGVPVYPFGYLTVLVFVLLTAYLTRHYGLVEVTAQLAAGEIAAMTRGALLITDRDGVIRVNNPRAVEVLGIPEAELVGRPARALLGDTFGTDKLALLARIEGGNVEKDLFYWHPRTGKAIDLVLSVQAVKDSHGREVAYVCVLRDVTEQKRAQQERLAEGLRDPLTGLPNRTMFVGLLDAAVQRHREAADYGFAVCFIGLDRMRVINEDLGPAAGDQVLAEVAGRLRSCIRPQDACARLGGDEFGVLLRNVHTPEDAAQIIERVATALRNSLRLSDHDLYISASIGVAGSDHAYANGADLLRSASIAMYRAKEQGGDSVVYVAAEGGAGQRTRLEADLRRAVVAGQIVVHYQPIIDLDGRCIAGFEALARWQHPQRGLLLPSEFVDYAERIGVVGTIDRIVIETACADWAGLEAAAARPVTLSLNVSESELLERGIVQHIEALCRAGGVPPARLAVEVVERIVQVSSARESFRRLRALGVGIAIDDFGTGYSALARLHELPVTTLKIDRAFVRAMTKGEGGEKVISSIIALARHLGLEVVAEGCSVGEEVHRLHALGVRYVQGFYFSEGVDVGTATRLLRNPAALADKFAAARLPQSAPRRATGS